MKLPSADRYEKIEPRAIMPVDGIKDALAMRKVRNECALFMTNNQKQIGIVEQIRWYRNYYNRTFQYRGFLLRKPIGIHKDSSTYGPTRNEVIGYGLISQKIGLGGISLWLSGGIKEKYRGRGYGEELFTFLRDAVDTAYLEVWDYNEPARALYHKLGFSILRAEGKKIIMVHKANAKKIKVKVQ